MLQAVFQGVYYFIEIFRYLLLAYCLLSWILPPQHQIMRIVGRFVEPLLGLIRPIMFRIFPRMPIDLSALVMFLILRLATSLLWRLYYLIA